MPSRPLPVSSPQTPLSISALVLPWLRMVQPWARSTGGEGQPFGFCPSQRLKVLVPAPLRLHLVRPAAVARVHPSHASLVPALGWCQGPQAACLPPAFPRAGSAAPGPRGVLRAWCLLSSCSCFCCPHLVPCALLRADPTHHGGSLLPAAPACSSPAALLSLAPRLLPAAAPGTCSSCG